MILVSLARISQSDSFPQSNIFIPTRHVKRRFEVLEPLFEAQLKMSVGHVEIVD